MNFDPTALISIVVELGLLYIPKVLLAAITFFVGFWLVKIIVRIVDKALGMRHVDDSLAGFLESLISIGLKALVLITVAGMVGVEMTSFIAIIGAAGLAIGLALQGSLANFAGGVLILLFKPYAVGDYIATQGHEGTVKKIDIFNTILITRENHSTVIPNGQVSNGSVINYSSEGSRRIECTFGIAYSDSIEKAKGVIETVVDGEQRVLQDRKPKVEVGNLGESSVDILCKVWVKPMDYWDVKYALTEKVKLAFDDAGISIPFPQRDVHIYKD